MPRVAFGIEYDGRAYSGWQRQSNGRTVQEMAEQAIGRVANESVRTLCAGRTDAGVHALWQVIHIETGAQRSERSWVLGANANLPEDIAVHWARPVSDDFHARFSATGRSYSYLILNRPSRPALAAGRVCWECRPLNVAAMREAAPRLLGRHDFSAFRGQGCQAKSPVRTLRRCEVLEHDGVLELAVAADAFLMHMVRNIAGVLLEIGLERQPPAWAGTVLAGRRRADGGVTAPPDGLYLTGVEYPAHFDLPEAGAATLAVPLPRRALTRL